MYSTLKVLDPRGVETRTKDLQRHRGEYITPGPNFIWSIDGHMKLEHWGIEIYAAIDAYSRYIVWLYVGISARTSVSVLKQYLEVVKDSEIAPKLLRSDRGTETGLCAAAHLSIHQEQIPTSELNDVHIFGTSVKNQRIEAWWGQLSKSQLSSWRVSKDNSEIYFNLTLIDLFSKIMFRWHL